MHNRRYCPVCNFEIYRGMVRCPWCGAPQKKERTPVGNFFIALLKCLGFYGCFFSIQMTVSMIYETVIMLTSGGIVSPGGIDMDAFYEEYSKFAPEVGILTAALVILAYFLFFKIIKKSFAKEIKLRPIKAGAVGSSFAFGLCAHIMIAVGLAILYSLLPELSELSNSESYELMYKNSNPITEFISISVVTGILEEVVFRGLIYNTLKKATGVKIAVFLSAVIFGAAHMNIEQFFYTSLLGALMAVVYEKYGTIIAPIIIHATFNGANYLLEYLDFKYFAPYVVLNIAAFAVFIIVFAFVFFTKKEPAHTLQKQRNINLHETL